jgi:superfamily II DNA/RNA helicase
MLVPDLWQHEAITHLREGRDAIVSAPTGSGKTLIFELWANDGRNRGQAVYTVPTRALANDKMAEWRQKGWNVGIATGDLAENLDAPIIVGTLEAQKNRLLQGKGPSLLVIDEYQMLGDAERGLNYELAIAQAPPSTQLLLLSGSVSNPTQIERWLARLGRTAATVTHHQRPVPLEEVFPMHLHFNLPGQIKGYWPQMIAKSLAEDLGPILIFAPRRAAAEKLAGELARQLPNPNPLQLSEEQKHLVGEPLAKKLFSRVAFHHSGLSYAVRAGVIEPLAKAGQLRVVVATMGLAAGINFSLRSVALAADSYRKNYQEQRLAPDEILQMLGRAGRRGIDETGFVVVSPNQIRLRDGYPVDLTRSRLIDWSALLGIMNHATESGTSPFAAAVSVQEKLFTTKPITLGVENALKNPNAPCQLKTDSERARLVRSHITQFLNSQGDWETKRQDVELELSSVFAPIYPEKQKDISETPGPENESTDTKKRIPRLVPALSYPKALMSLRDGGQLIVVDNSKSDKVYGQSIKIADQIENNRILLGKRLRRLTKWKGRYVNQRRWDEKIVPLITQVLHERSMPLIRFSTHEQAIFAEVSLAEQKATVQIDQHGQALWQPELRTVAPPVCDSCNLADRCKELPTSTGTALLWRRLKLINEKGEPSTRGRIVSFFSHGDGLAIAASLEDETYPLTEFVFDIANLDGGFRFSGEEYRWAGRIAESCRQAYGSANIAGYLENGLPQNYGDGASQIVHSLHNHTQSKHQWTTDLLGVGDIDRIVIEWRSRLRQISSSPPLSWDRWTKLQIIARSTLSETESPTTAKLPKLSLQQNQRVSHRLHPSQFRQRLAER